jgi:arsenate reductase (glutaredoxin)
MEIWHNPRCRKSREALAFLTEGETNFVIREYLKELPSKQELKDLVKKLGIKAEELIRKNEPEFKQNFTGKTLSENDCIEAMIIYPKLIQRPIIVKGDKAIIARPASLYCDV